MRIGRERGLPGDDMRWRIGTVLAALVLACGGCLRGDGRAGVEPGYREQVAQWRAQRLEELRASDGWLSYTGSGRLKPGRYRVGSAPDNDVRLPGGPARLGILTLDGHERAYIEAAAGSGAMLDGQPLQAAELVPEQAADERPGSHIRLGTADFYLVRTGAVWGWRYRDPDAAARRDFKGVEHFLMAPEWRVVAQWHPFPKPKQVVLLTSIGTPLPAEEPGEARFEIDGRRYSLRPVLQMQESEDRRLFFLFTDRTSGRETYGGARYLFASAPRDGTVVLDFNRAHNPPCALTPHVVCPVAPPGNRLDLRVNAGEKVFVSAY